VSKYIDGINEENMDAFLAALRSGEFEQGKYHLNQNGKMCCLGVASELAHRAGVVTKEVDEYGAAKYNGYTGILGEKVAEWLGLPNTHDGDVAFHKSGYRPNHIGHGYMAITAMGYNDLLNKSFLEIADAFEKEFLKED
jgi:hypothetical protein